MSNTIPLPEPVLLYHRPSFLAGDYIYITGHTPDQMHAHAAAVSAAKAAEIAGLRNATQLCDKHQPKGGARGMCVICAGESLQGALSRIDYACGEPNEMECSDYDVHMNEQAVVERVQALRERVRLLEDALGDAADAIESWGLYADEYFRAKHNLQGDIDAARAALGDKTPTPPPSSSPRS